MEAPEPGDERRRSYVEQRETVEAVAAGARALALDSYADVIDRIHAQELSTRTYEDEGAYADVVAFNAGLAAESMLEDDGELTTPP